MALSFVTSPGGRTAMYDTVTDWAFGPVFRNETAAKRFLQWAEDEGVPDGDVRALRNADLSDLWQRYAEETEDPHG